MDTHDLVPTVEALVFGAARPLDAAQVAEILETDTATAQQALDHLQALCEQQRRGVFLERVAGGFQLRTRPEYAEFLRRLGRRRPFRFSRAAMETLAIIAYRQPVTRPDIEYLRGVDSGSVIKTLMEKHLVRILGKKDIPGKPMIYGTTTEFLELFSLPDLASLPTLQEFSELANEGQAIDADDDVPDEAERGSPLSSSES